MSMRVEKKMLCVSLIRVVLLLASLLFFSLWFFWEASNVWAWLAVSLDTVEFVLYRWQCRAEKSRRLKERQDD